MERLHDISFLIKKRYDPRDAVLPRPPFWINERQKRRPPGEDVGDRWSELMDAGMAVPGRRPPLTHGKHTVGAADRLTGVSTLTFVSYLNRAFAADGETKT